MSFLSHPGKRGFWGRREKKGEGGSLLSGGPAPKKPLSVIVFFRAGFRRSVGGTRIEGWGRVLGTAIEPNFKGPAQKLLISLSEYLWLFG